MDSYVDDHYTQQPLSIQDSGLFALFHCISMISVNVKCIIRTFTLIIFISGRLKRFTAFIPLLSTSLLAILTESLTPTLLTKIETSSMISLGLVSASSTCGVLAESVFFSLLKQLKSKLPLVRIIRRLVLLRSN